MTMPAAPTISPLSDAERQRRRRERMRTGARVFRGEIPRRLIRKLIWFGLLTEAEADDPQRLGEALCQAVEHEPDEKKSLRRDTFLGPTP